MLSLNTLWGRRRRLADLFVFETESHCLGWPPLTMSLKKAELLIVLSLLLGAVIRACATTPLPCSAEDG